MKVRVNECGCDGKPVAESGEVLEGASHLDIVEGMKLSPFTAGVETRPYMEEVLRNIKQEGFALPDGAEAAAQSFLLKLASLGYVQFVADGPPNVDADGEAPPCMKG